MKTLNSNQKKNLMINFANWKAKKTNYKGSVIFDAMTHDFWLGNDFYTFESVMEGINKSLSKKSENERNAILENISNKIFEVK